MKKSKKILSLVLLLTMAASSLLCATEVQAKDAQRHEITGKTVGASLLSLIIWPGIGQAVNDQPGRKVGWHAVVGLLPPFRFWSAYDALYDREGGYWEGKI